jgi:outer membrane protein OmpA-like peptidoglycan-associated protein
MRPYLRYIAGASAVAAAALAATQWHRVAQREGEPEIAAAAPAVVETAPPILVADAAPQPPALPQPTSAAPQVAARIADLTGRLAEREAELAALEASLAARDANLDAITATLSQREAEIQALQDELAALRDRYAFDLELAALKSGDRTADQAVIGAEALLASVKGSATVADAPSVLALTEILFDTGSSSLSPGGQVHAAAAAVMLVDMPVLRVRVVGHTDRTGSPARNRVLAEARARAVADFLVTSGVPVALIEAAGAGEDELPVLTDDGVPEPLNRAVAIIAIPRPTS